MNSLILKGRAGCSNYTSSGPTAAAPPSSKSATRTPAPTIYRWTEQDDLPPSAVPIDYAAMSSGPPEEHVNKGPTRQIQRDLCTASANLVHTRTAGGGRTGEGGGVAGGKVTRGGGATTGKQTQASQRTATEDRRQESADTQEHRNRISGLSAILQSKAYCRFNNVREAFRMVDLDKSGRVDREEMRYVSVV